MRISVMLIVFALLSSVSTPLHARVKTVGKGDKLNFDPLQIPQEMKGAFELMNVKCIQCHTQERAVIAIQSGIAPVSGQPFDEKAAKAYGDKLLHKSKAKMTKEEMKQVVNLMTYLIAEAAKP